MEKARKILRLYSGLRKGGAKYTGICFIVTGSKGFNKEIAKREKGESGMKFYKWRSEFSKVRHCLGAGKSASPERAILQAAHRQTDIPRVSK